MITTRNLKFVLPKLAEARAQIEAMPAADKAHLSAEWLARLAAANHDDPWVLGFILADRETGAPVGQCGFKGPPDSEGTVEIAYMIQPEHQGRGFATEAAEALTRFAFESSKVRVVRAHTLPEPNASTRVLTKCGFTNIGEVIDPEDGRVWRWEKRPDAWLSSSKASSQT